MRDSPKNLFYFARFLSALLIGFHIAWSIPLTVEMQEPNLSTYTMRPGIEGDGKSRLKQALSFPSAGLEESWILAPRLDVVFQRMEQSAPEAANRFKVLQALARTRWDDILANRVQPLRIAVVIPAYHREIQRIQSQDSIVLKLEELQQLAETDRREKTEFILYVVDDKAPEGLQPVVEDSYARANIYQGVIRLRTLRLARELAARNPAVSAVGDLSQSVKWGALALGMATAVREGADIVVMSDVDTNQRLTEIPSIIYPIVKQNASAVVGSRFLPGSSTNNMAIHNYIELFLFNPLAHTVFPEIRNVRDVQSGFKAFSAAALKKALPRMRTFRLAGDSELLYLIASTGGKIVEVPRSELEEAPEATTIDAARYADFVTQLIQQKELHKAEALLTAQGRAYVEAIQRIDVQNWRVQQDRLEAAVTGVQEGVFPPEQAAQMVADILFAAGLEEEPYRVRVEKKVVSRVTKDMENPAVYFDADLFNSAKKTHGPSFALVQGEGNEMWIHMHLTTAAPKPRRRVDDPGLLFKIIVRDGKIVGLTDVLAESLAPPLRGFVPLKGLIPQDLLDRLTEIGYRLLMEQTGSFEKAIQAGASQSALLQAIAPGEASGIFEMMSKRQIARAQGISGSDRITLTTSDGKKEIVFRVLSKEAGLEGYVDEQLALLADAAQGPGILVIETAVLSRRISLEEFVARVPADLSGRIVLFGEGAAPVKERALENNIVVVESGQVADLVIALASFRTADRIGFLGSPQWAAALSRMLPASMKVVPLDPAIGFRQILLSLGIPRAVLDQIDLSLLEEELTTLHSA
ncbi:MAG: hypothetical protein NC819_01300 [Candidatus Omnitrophica bacterium]|nr:hypothetical protein [Candidatus Omnitrophota bacterium]